MSRLLDQVRASCRRRGYSYRTEQTYCRWILRYARFHELVHPKKLGADAIEAFLTHLATERKVAASTQNEALNALVFLYREVLEQDVGAFDGFVRAKAPRRLPVVLSRREVRALLGKMRGPRQFIASLLYGSGLRLSDALRLRIKDLDFERRQLIVRSGKGKKDRLTMLPEPLETPLRRQLKRARLAHEEDLANGLGAVYLPKALARKYPKAEKEWIWQWVFPSRRLSKDPRSGKTRRHHRSASTVQKAVKRAAPKAGIEKRVSPHVLRHSFISLRFVNLPAVGLPHTSWRTAPTSARYSNSSATKI